MPPNTNKSQHGVSEHRSSHILFVLAFSVLFEEDAQCRKHKKYEKNNVVNNWN